MSSKEIKKYNSKMLSGESYKKTESMIQSRDVYYPRDLSWIDFNRRVLYRCIDERVPKMERLNFMSITTSNLDDFISARMSYLYNQSIHRPYETGISGLTYKDEFKITLKSLCKFKHDQIVVYKKLLKQLEKDDIYISANDLTSEQVDEMKAIFQKEILPLLYVVRYDTMTEEPTIRSGNLCLLNVSSNKDETFVRIVEIPNSLPRFIWIPSTKRFISLKAMIKFNLYDLLGQDLNESYFFRVIREGDIVLSGDKTKHIRNRVDEFCLTRSNATPIFLEVNKDTPKYVIKILKSMFSLKGKFIYPTNVFGPSFTFNRNFKYDKYTSYDNRCTFLPVFREEGGSELLFPPYCVYDEVIKLLEDAGEDKNVTMICMTLYRVSGKESPIIKALCNAARNKKRHVCVVLELRARTDEETNIELIDTLKKSGVQVVHGFEKYKTHAKMISIARLVDKEIHYTTLISTGNFNEKTAKIYSDVVYLTENQPIGRDVANVFSYIIAGTPLKDMESNCIFISPHGIKQQIINEIDKEIASVRNNREGHVILKLNSISDYEVINKIYEASKEGVEFDIIVRGICSILPNKNIRIKSIVGRYLEHSRIYKFGNDRIYIASADMLTRNLDKRVELMAKIQDEKCFELLNQVLTDNLNDTLNSFVLTDKGWKVIKDKEENRTDLFTRIREHLIFAL